MDGWRRRHRRNIRQNPSGTRPTLRIAGSDLCTDWSVTWTFWDGDMMVPVEFHPPSVALTTAVNWIFRSKAVSPGSTKITCQKGSIRIHSAQVFGATEDRWQAFVERLAAIPEVQTVEID